MTRVDLLIVGAGPAGLTLAWKAAEHGLRVVVVDQKPSADHAAYLTSASFMDLREWGVPEDLAQPIESLHLASRGASVTVPSPCWMLNRRKLLAFLAQRAREYGVEFLFNARVTGVELAGGRIQRVTIVPPGTRQELSAAVFADCSGTGRVLERHARLVPPRHARQTVGAEYVVPLRREPRTLDFYFGSHFGRGYGWLFPLDDRTAVLGCGTLDPAKFRDIRFLLDRMFEFPRVRERVERSVLEANGGIFWTGMPLKTFHRGNVMVVGDAALQGNPVIGEGIRFVMDAARLAADAAAHAVREDEVSLLSRYSSSWVRKYYHQYRAGYFAQRVSSFLTADDDLCDSTIRRLGRAPPDAVVRVIQGDVSYKNALKDLLRFCLARMRGRFYFSPESANGEK